MDPQSSIHRRRSDDATRRSNSRTNRDSARLPRLHHSTSEGGNTASQDRNRLASSTQPNPAASNRRTGSGQGETWTDFLRSTAATSDGARYMNGTYGRPNTVRSSYSTGAHHRHISAAGSAQSASRKRLLSEGATTTRREPPGPSATTSSRLPPARGSGRSMDDPVNLDSPSPPRRQVIFPRRISDNRRSSDADIVLPPWQRDEDSMCCPVCHTAFSWYFRKHHCRKCGRVVCANCSLHRIAIPRKYIVQPPPVAPKTLSEQQQQQQQRAGLIPGTAQISPDVSQNVRVCNPCVPDPNLNPPPQQQTQSDGRSHAPSSNQAHLRHASSTFPSAGANSIDGPTSLLEAARRMTNVASPVASSGDRSTSDSVTNASHQPLSGGAPSAVPWPGWSVHHRNYYHPNRHSTSHQSPGANDPGASFRAEWQRRRQALYNDYTQPPRSANPTQMSQPVVNEADQCPICLRALPPIDSTTGSDELRTAHIVRCITRAERRHSGASTGQSPTARRSVVDPSNSGTSISSRTTDPLPLYPGSAGRTASLNARPLPPTPTADSQRDDNDDDADDDPSPPTGVMQDMLRFRASAADCVNNEEKGGSAPECIICFEEFEEGQVLGRLGCLCRFHANCLEGWWRTKRTTECPTHMSLR